MANSTNVESKPVHVITPRGFGVLLGPDVTPGRSLVCLGGVYPARVDDADIEVMSAEYVSGLRAMGAL